MYSMNKSMNKFFMPLTCCCAGIFSPVMAAPLDAFLSAHSTLSEKQVQIETVYDVVNSRVDFLRIRANDPAYAGTNVGDYHGAHLRASMALTSALSIDGSVWDRTISHLSDKENIKTWQAALQYQLQQGVGHQPSVALRVGAWGNYSSETKKSSPTRIGSETLNSVTVSAPKDQQVQLDLIATSTIFFGTELTGFAGGGVSHISLGAISGTATKAGCQYNIAVGATDTVGTLATPCNAAIVIQQFNLPNHVYGIDINRDARYHASYLQGGVMLRWHDDSATWHVRAGYHYQLLNRKAIDDTVVSKGGTPYRSNNIFVGEIGYAFFKNATLFVRGQYMSNQFVGEIPFVYNALTASRFNRRYGLLSTGLSYTF